MPTADDISKTSAGSGRPCIDLLDLLELPHMSPVLLTCRLSYRLSSLPPQMGGPGGPRMVVFGPGPGSGFGAGGFGAFMG